MSAVTQHDSDTPIPVLPLTLDPVVKIEENEEAYLKKRDPSEK